MVNQFPYTVPKVGSELLPNDYSRKLRKILTSKRNSKAKDQNSQTIMQLKVLALQPEQRSAKKTSQKIIILKQKTDHSSRINAFSITMIMFPLFSRLIEANHLSPNEVIQKEQQQHHHRHHPHQMDSIVKKVTASLISQQTTPSLTRIVEESTTTNTVNKENKPPRPSPTPFTIQSSTYNSFATAAKSRNKKMITKMLESTQTADSNGTGDSDSFSETPIDSKLAAAAAAAKSSSTIANNMFDVDAFMPPGYDKLMPPKQNGKPTKVRFHVWVLGLDSIDEGSMSYVADIFMSQSWKDNRLVIPEDITFNVNTSSDPRGPYRLLPLTLIDKIWRPDSFFKNAKEVTFQEMTIPNHYIWLYSDNTILYMVKLTLLLSCAMKFQTYPHDTQNCTLKIESLSYTTNDLVFDWEESDPLVVEEHIELPQHDLIRKDIDYCTTDYSSGTFACVQVIFTIKRRLGYYIFHTYIPTCLIVIMSWISFWIKPEAVPARVTLCVTSLLTLSTQHAQSQKSLPPVSYIKAIDIFMSSCTVFVFASLMEYALVNILMSDELLNGWIGMEPPIYQERSTLTAPTQQQQQQQQSKVPTSTQSKPSQKPLHNMIHHQQPVRFHSLTKLDTLLNSNESLTNHGSNHELNINSGFDLHHHHQQHHRGAEPIISKDPMMNITSASKLRHRNCSMFHKKDSIEDCRTNQQDLQQQSLPSLLPRTNYSFLRAQSFAFNSGMGIGKTNLDHSSNQYLLQNKHKRAYTVDHVSRWVFPLSFIMLNFVYWTYYLELLESIGIAQLFRKG